MKVSHIEFKNFKTFDDLSVDLNDFNVLIGACASGKSHFVEIFQFLKDFSFYCEDGISQHGGNHLINYNHCNDDKHCYFKVIFKNCKNNENILLIVDSKLGFKVNEYLLIKFNELKYEVSFFPEKLNYLIFILFPEIKMDFQSYPNQKIMKLSKHLLMNWVLMRFL